MGYINMGLNKPTSLQGFISIKASKSKRNFVDLVNGKLV